MSASSTSRRPPANWIREVLRSGTLAGLAMIPFAAFFRARGLRVNEYGRKTLELVVGDVSPLLHSLLAFAQHLAISWVAAVPQLWLLERVEGRLARVLVGALYGAGFYGVVNSWVLPLFFRDPTPWQLGFQTGYPSLVIHLVYGVVVALAARRRDGSGAVHAPGARA